LPIGKKLPAGRRTAEALALTNVEQTTTATLTPTLSRQRERGQKLDSSFRWNDEQNIL